MCIRDRASRTCVTKEIVERLSLDKIGDVSYENFEGQFMVMPKYSVDISIQGVEALFEINALELFKNNKGVDVLIGLDIINLGELLISKHNEVPTLKFNAPKLT